MLSMLALQSMLFTTETFWNFICILDLESQDDIFLVVKVCTEDAIKGTILGKFLFKHKNLDYEIR
jgi:hypothetical protein